MNILVSMLLLVCLIGCDREAVRHAQDSLENKAITSVQQARSCVPGVSCMDSINRMLTIAESHNIQIKNKGWMAYQDQSRIVVVFAFDRNKEPLGLTWYIENDEIIPVNGLSRGVSVRQKITF